MRQARCRKMTESDTMRSIQIKMTELGHRVFRNNCGLFFTKDGRPVKTGLCVGSSDLIGLLGDKSGRILAIEVKSKNGKISKDQESFINMINSMGGVAFFARSVEESVDKINKLV